jgi:tetratricopeptide (TPR) repeat protein
LNASEARSVCFAEERAMPLEASTQGSSAGAQRSATGARLFATTAVPFAPALAALLALTLQACAGAERRPAHDRLPLDSDIQRCVLRTEAGNELMGRLRFHLLVRRDGPVYAAYVHNELGASGRKLEGCIGFAMTNWVLPEADAAYERAYEISFAPGDAGLASEFDYQAGFGWSGHAPPKVFLPSMYDSPPPLPLEFGHAQATLTIAEFATTGERGLALATVGNAREALPVLRDALEVNPSDREALLGLVQALALAPEQARSAAEAREAAQRLQALDPGAADGEEAVLRACLAAKDDRCAVEQWPRLLKARGAKTRSRIVQTLEESTRAAAARLTLSGQRQASGG